MGFDDILAGMGIDGRAVGGAGATGHGHAVGGLGPAQARAETPVHEATAEITLDEAYHGTTRLVEVDGKRLEITIPKGAESGTRIKLTGRGPGGGDLIVVVRMLPDARFTRRGADLERDLPLTLEEALLGAEVPIETAQGPRPADDPGRDPARTDVPPLRPGDAAVQGRRATATSTSSPASSCRPTCPTRRRSAAKTFLFLADQPDPRSD